MSDDSELLKYVMYELLARESLVTIFEYVVQNQGEDGYTSKDDVISELDGLRDESTLIPFGPILESLIFEGHIEHDTEKRDRVKLTDTGINFLIELKLNKDLYE